MERVPNNINLGTQTNARGIDTNKLETFYAVLDRIRDLGFKGFKRKQPASGALFYWVGVRVHQHL